RRHTSFSRDWSSDVCSSDLGLVELVFFHPVADRQQLSFRPHEKGKIHLEGEFARALAQFQQARAQCVESLVVAVGVLHMRLAGSLYPVGPVDNHLASHRAYFRMDGSRELADFRSKNRSEEHTSELQSRENLVCRLLLEK